MSLPVISTYLAKEEHSEQVAALLASNWELLHDSGLTTDHPAFLMRDPEQPNRFVEVFEWKDEEGPDQAWENAEIAELWNQIQSLCEQEIDPVYYEMIVSTYGGGG